MLSSIAGLVMFSIISVANADHHLGKEGKYSGTIGFSTKSESVTAISENHLFVVGIGTFDEPRINLGAIRSESEMITTLGDLKGLH